MYYFDTNAFWKYYYDQKGALEIRRLVSSSGFQVFISQMTLLECLGVLMKYYRKKLIKRRELNSILKRIRRDVGTRNTHRPFSLILLSTKKFQVSEQILLNYADRHAIQTNDALHLAVALDIANNGNEIIFVTSDNALYHVATSHTLSCFNPEN